jgi:hypothetical protein
MVQELPKIEGVVLFLAESPENLTIDRQLEREDDDTSSDDITEPANGFAHSLDQEPKRRSSLGP